MRPSYLQEYYSAIIASGRAGVPTIREAHRDLNRVLAAVQFGSLTG